MQNGQNLPRHFDVILGHVDRFETDQKALTPAPAGTAAPTGPATALASPGTSQTELIRVFYAVLYPDFTHTGGILANCRDVLNTRAESPRPTGAARESNIAIQYIYKAYVLQYCIITR